MTLLDPNTIIIRRAERQRQATLDFADIQASIAAIGQINPIIVRRDGVDTILMAGERRLLACRALERPVEVKFWHDLDPTAAREIELEENIKREDLHWRDLARAYGELHETYLRRDPTWTISKSMERLSISAYLHRVLDVHRNLSSPLLDDAISIENAYGILQRAAERKTAEIVQEMLAIGDAAFNPPGSTEHDPPPSPYLTGPAPTLAAGELPPPSILPTAEHPPLPFESGSPLSLFSPTTPPTPADPILNLDFTLWAENYVGPKFNLIHCDFPYGIAYDSFAKSTERGVGYDSRESDYTGLLNSFVANFSHFASYSCHVVFWFSMTFYEETKRALESTGLWVHEHPLIWFKTDNAGIVPGTYGQYPRRIYETAFLASLGKRTLVKAFSNAHGAPTADKPLHPSQKPEPVLRHFLSGLIDSTTDFFDPTCGSGSSLRAAEDCGAKSVLGLELNPEFASAALAATLRARTMRKLGEQ